ncbi:PXA domain-containing protein [Tricharina praecox]|uniref:PXA domain-containing protein n=1 Tax=Tricharina praecox TaxID=43433 RepID=UPI00221F15DC|nr:PXA domain-containing protein [Tricharina praecox]KAI5853373.1 PXA domain-containing protein [Tricharina praecox]
MIRHHATTTSTSTSPPTPSTTVGPSPPPPDDTVLTDLRTLALIRRVLCTHSPPTRALDELLPALTSSAETDVELYALVAIVARDYVFSWYAALSNDSAFGLEVVALIAHLTRGVEERVRKLDLEGLLLDEVPAVVEAHVADYRRAVERKDTALAPQMDLAEIFRSYQPHPAFANGAESERQYLQLLSNGLLAVLLPNEDLDSDCERSLLREILASLVFGGMLDKLSEPFMLYEIITTLVRKLQPDLAPLDPPSVVTSRRSSVKPGAVRIETPPPGPPSPPPAPPGGLERTFTIVASAVSTIYSVLASLHHLLLNPLPPRPPKRRTLIRSALPTCLSTLLNFRSLQPWLPSAIRLLTKPFESRNTFLGTLLDDLLISKLTPHLTSPQILIDILRSARATLFPGNMPAPPRKYPSEKEKKRIRTVAEYTLLAAFPEVVTKVWWGAREKKDMARLVGKHWLDPFADKDVNKVLIVRLLDLIVGRLLPELLVSGGVKLRGVRSGDGDSPSEESPEESPEEGGKEEKLLRGEKRLHGGKVLVVRA